MRIKKIFTFLAVAGLSLTWDIGYCGETEKLKADMSLSEIKEIADMTGKSADRTELPLLVPVVEDKSNFDQKLSVLEVVEIDKSGNSTRWYLDFRKRGVNALYGASVMFKAEMVDYVDDKHLSSHPLNNPAKSPYSLREAAYAMHRYCGIWEEKDPSVLPRIGANLCYVPRIREVRYYGNERTGRIVSIRAIGGDESGAVLETIDWIHRAYLKIELEEHPDGPVVKDMPDDFKRMVEGWDI